MRGIGPNLHIPETFLKRPILILLHLIFSLTRGSSILQYQYPPCQTPVIMGGCLDAMGLERGSVGFHPISEVMPVIILAQSTGHPARIKQNPNPNTLHHENAHRSISVRIEGHV